MQIEEFLKKFHIFADLTPDEFVGIAASFFHRVYKKGECLLREGDISPQLILIESGEVAIYRTAAKGGEALGVRVAGESLGEFTVFGSTAHTATAISATEVSAFVALGSDFHKLVAENTPGIGKITVRLLGVAVDRFRKMEEKATLAAGSGIYEPTIEGRLMHAIATRESVRVSFYSGSEKDVEGAFRIVDVSSEMGVPMVRLAMDLEMTALRNKDIRVREYVIPMSGLHFISFDSSAKS